MPLALAAAQDTPRIVRDSWGVPHVYGRTDAVVVKGLMIAQAEDNFWQLEEDTLRSLGRSAEVLGPGGIASDTRLRAFEVTRLAREEYSRMAPYARGICDAYAEGVNAFLDSHPKTKPRRLARWEPWFILAIQNAGNVGLAERRGTAEGDEGSNMWAVAPSRTRSKRALMLINPHIGFFGGGQRYEAHLHSKQGLDVGGFAILGTPYIRSGFTPRHAWSHTNNYADVSDSWEVQPPFEEWTEELLIKSGDGFDTRQITLRKSSRGAVFHEKDGKWFAVRAPLLDKRGTLEQRIAMAKARNLAEFKRALARLAIVGSNTLYADRRGNIFYVHGGAIPKRGPDREWLGYHGFDELPQITNPASGYLQNCNSTPALAAGEDSIDLSRFPKYMVPESDNLRAERSRQILSRSRPFTFDDWALAAFDTTAVSGPKDLAVVLPHVDAELAAELGKWDGTVSVDSVAATLYLLSARPQLTPQSLAKTQQDLEAAFGTWRVPWGEVNRLQRIHTSGVQEEFSDARPSLPVAGCPGTLGCLFAFNTRKPEGAKRAYGYSGNTYVAVVELGRKVRVESQLVFGQSADPASPHFLDQAPLYSERRFKRAR